MDRLHDRAAGGDARGDAAQLDADFEGDPFVSGGGLEFLFGYAFEADDGSPFYVADWALSRVEERAAFEKFIDLVQARLAEHPDLHVYHFALYEPAALKSFALLRSLKRPAAAQPRRPDTKIDGAEIS